MIAKVYVTLKSGVLDPQGKAVLQALHRLDHKNVKDVRQGKYFELKMDASSQDAAKAQLSKMCDELLANTVIEDYRFEIEE